MVWTIWRKFPLRELYYADPARALTLADDELSDLDPDLSEELHDLSLGVFHSAVYTFSFSQSQRFMLYIS